MKVFLQIIAWLGVVIIALSVPVAYGAGGYNVDMYEMGLGFASMVCDVGAVLFLLGGLISRGRFLWQIGLIAGIIYIAVLPRSWVPHETVVRSVGWMGWGLILMAVLPGVLIVVGSIWMRRLRNKSNNSTGNSKTKGMTVGQ